MDIRTIKENDSEAFYQMMCKLDNETKYMMYEPGERSNPDILKENIKSAILNEDFVLVAEDEGKIVGFIWAEKGTLNRIRHTAYVVTGITQEYCGRGIGKTFFKKLDEWAKLKNIIRLELTVECDNVIAKHLYENMGFVVEGRRLKAMKVDGNYVDEYYMGKIL